MFPINSTFAPLQAFADELARSGMEYAVTSPGSRNAPLALSLASDGRLRCISVIDERSAGFLALGIAKATGKPVAVTCTSGTAAANLLPAVVEAHEARVPLLVLTADRPPELRDTGAGQAIDQLKLYGSFAKWFVEVGNHPPGRESAIHHRSLACRAYATANSGRPGPVHLNFGLREPLAPVREELDQAPWQGRAGGRPWVDMIESPPEPSRTMIEELVREISEAPRGVIVAGSVGSDVADPVARLAAAAGWPLLADPMSGLRCGGHDRSHVVAHYDVLLRSDRFAVEQRPDVVLRIGDMPTSKPLRAWLAETSQLVIDPDGAWHDPARTAEKLFVADPAPTCELVAEALEQRSVRGPSPEWLGTWEAADLLVGPALERTPESFEPKVYTALCEALPDGATVWVGSSMPVRDLETFFPQVGRELRFLSNRGANGIDGVVSSAAGAAIASGAPTFLVVGEISLLHDMSGLLTVGRHNIDVTIVCINNGGGRIFDFLPVAQHADPALYEEHVLTPVRADLSRAAELAGVPYTLAESPSELPAVLGAAGLIEVRTDPAANVALHRQVFHDVAAQLA